ncbi:MAG: polyamine aminopropyltransferase [Desulfomonile tiedjei]|nr:polyamine aminopropyltransferase [Desulfomonile tiedjei]
MSLNQSEWFTEAFENRTAFSVRYSNKLLDEVSSFQRIEVFDSDFMGRVLVLAGCFMVTDKDSFIYHEMLLHPAMALVSAARRILIIGGGDGGAVTEAVKYPAVESVTLCEIDPQVVSACRRFFPEISAGLDDPRVTVVNEDGAAYVKNFEEEFDIILVDSTDPVGPGKALYEISFYESIRRALKPGGAAVFQTESPLFMEDVFSMAQRDLGGVFGHDRIRPYLATVPSYPGGLWSFTFCSKDLDPVAQALGDVAPEVRKSLKYYSAEVHRAAFALPAFVTKLVDESRS